MNALFAIWPTLAQVAPSKKLAESFRKSGNKIGWDDAWPWLLAAAIAAGVYVAYRIRQKRNDMTQPCDDPAKLFRELCQVHALDGASRRLLRRLADACGFGQPAQVFLTPAVFTGEQTPAALGAHSDALRRLREKLF